MKVTKQQLAKSEIKLTIELDENELTRFREQAASSLSGHVQIPGFRDGKAPAFTVESAVGKEKFFNEVLRFAFVESYAQAVSQEKIAAASRPKITVLSDYPLKYEAVVATMPEVTIKDYSHIKVPLTEVAISDEELEVVLREMRKMHATRTPREDGVQKGDRVEIDFVGFDEEGKELENTRSKNHPLFVGEGTLVADFEQQLLGMKAGENKKFEVVFPSDYVHKPFQNKKVAFEVSMKKAEATEIPSLDEAYVEKVTGKKMSVSEFTERVRGDLEHQKKLDAQVARENTLIQELLKLLEVEIPEALLEEEIDFLVEQMKYDLAQKQLSFEQYEEYLKSKNRNVREEKRNEALERLRVRLLLNELFKRENIAAADDEIEKEVESAVSRYPENEQQKARDLYERDRNRHLQIANNIKLQKLFDRLLAA